MRSDVLERGRRVLCAEADAIRALADRLDARFVQAVDLLLTCRGRVVTTGVGKAGAIARKFAATLSSTGTPALFLHPADAVHGDLGSITAEDVVIALSYSGESDEVVRLLPSLGRIGACLIALVGNEHSTLARAAAVVLNVHVESEACPLGLAPTTSAAAMLACGDALALAAMEARGFTREDFAAFHPAGALGKRLTLRVSDVMRTGDRMAVVPKQTLLREALFAITKAEAGSVQIVDEAGKLVGIITDGDVRRALLADPDALQKTAESLMNPNPLVITGNLLAAEALNILEESPKRPGEAPVIDAERRPIGVISLKDLLRSGIV
ncbi:MAG TPA: KpsF/GutQ family sugar-phosphate isomerase [Chthonomonadales bacterium]|nr:KpsF/GutQ family sugar-phosphate isomerase [Chthonomonadales bacterium]